MTPWEIRAAGRHMRETHDPAHKRHAMWGAIADWLEHTARRIEVKVEGGGNTRAVWSTERHAANVARAYLDAIPGGLALGFACPVCEQRHAYGVRCLTCPQQIEEHRGTDCGCPRYITGG